MAVLAPALSTLTNLEVLSLQGKIVEANFIIDLIFDVLMWSLYQSMIEQVIALETMESSCWYQR